MIVKVILFGAPAAGKGTQAKVLSEKLATPHVASGDLFREHHTKGTELGKQAMSYMERGVLVPDSVTIKIILDRLAQPDCQGGFVLDGFPRTIDQAKALEEALQETEGGGVDVIVNIKVSEEELVRRISGRLICRKCQTPYHREFSPPKVDKKCDKCVGGELYQRRDDTPKAAKKRLMVYSEVTEPLLQYYSDKGKLKEVERGDAPIEEVAKQINEVLAIQ